MADQIRRGFRVTPQAVLGLLIIAFGLLLTADNLGWLDADRVLEYWPIGIVIVGLAKVVQARTVSGRVFGLVIILFGAGLTAQHVYWLPINVWHWWPLLIVVVGVLIMFQAFGKFGGEPGVPLDAPTTSDAQLSEFAVWSGIERRVSSPAFRHGDLTAIMGGIEIDFRQAGTFNGEAVLDVFALWGGIEITVPPDWAVSNRVTPIMGGAEDKSSGTQAAKHRLVIRGFAIMGGISIKT